MNRPKVRLWLVWAWLLLVFFAIEGALHVLFHLLRGYDWATLLALSAAEATLWTFLYAMTRSREKR